jgi:hypothetical protein
MPYLPRKGAGEVPEDLQADFAAFLWVKLSPVNVLAGYC